MHNKNNRGPKKNVWYLLYQNIDMQLLVVTRSHNNAFYFEFEGSRTRVCKTFFMNMSYVSSKMVYSTCKKKKNIEGIVEKDGRGRHGNCGRAVEPDLKAFIRELIESFPTLDAHYCRELIQKKVYLRESEFGYNVHDTKCMEVERPYGKQHMYESIFNTEYNISFQQPKKDQCSRCEPFKNLNEEDKLEHKELFYIHKLEKELSRNGKELDIHMASENNTQVVCFDMQAVLPVPCVDANLFYYKHGLSCYNFTVYNIVKKQRTLLLLALRYIYNYLRSFPTEHVVFYCDNCAGQNRSKFMTALFIHCLLNIREIESITQRFLVVGHMQNEGDAMHTLIERERKRALRGGRIYVPGQIILIIQLAK
ncbi:hypothetical protein PR048_015377 [Dryococelus australis]|uniref:DUF7869 domain-containing protein n=1 Tax=Dryococelus australis TaxID=614101 RepID=A0ABQ9HGS8_9NEOP|nr:hypothetical protein PR048_015377 [Dryococelus australis]